MKYTSLPPLKRKQKEIPQLIFRFRYINRLQFQKLTNEPHQPNMNTRLKQLVDNRYLKCLYEETQKTKYTLAKYCMGNTGINYLKNLGYDQKSLKKYYQDDTRSLEFQEKCLLIVDAYLNLLAKSKNLKETFEFYTKADFIPGGPMKELNPDFGYVYEGKKILSYTCEIFDLLMIDIAVKSRIKKYFDFFSEEEEECHIIFICPTDHIYKIVSKQTRILLAQEVTGENIHFSITTIEKMRNGDIGEKISLEEE